jgi:predicted enzyme related to lactoylglutathione lyase
MSDPKQASSFGAMSHAEIPASDVEKAKAFYADCFGWTYRDIPEMAYTLFDSGNGGISGGILKKPDGYPSQMVNYIGVEDVNAASEKVKAMGGKVLQERQEIPDTGWHAVAADPDGNIFGLWQEMKR